MFVLVTDEIMGGLRQKWIAGHGWKRDNVGSSCPGYADDILLFSHSNDGCDAFASAL